MIPQRTSAALHYALITTEDPTAAGVVTYLVPAVSVALDATFLSEPTGPNLLGGAALILLGVALVQRRRSTGTAHQAASPRSLRQ
jgi:MYXO-CTERM domain-containing protein